LAVAPARRDVFLAFRPTPSSTLFPYTTLFRSRVGDEDGAIHPVVRSVGSREDRGGAKARPDRGAGLGRVGCGNQWLAGPGVPLEDRKSTRLNSSHDQISYAVFCLKKKKQRRFE